MPVSDNQNSLKSGRRGPTPLKDFVLRVKIFHFDHERIPERIVHARGSGAHAINAPPCPLGNFQREGKMQTQVSKGRANYEPNSLPRMERRVAGVNRQIVVSAPSLHQPEATNRERRCASGPSYLPTITARPGYSTARRRQPSRRI
ncbi:catalase [Sphingomonas sp.]|uniref:catalase n=1 Tax=Sphingomonas sp. TaxID=28214 RepID=UPI0026240B9E|nr:catalase [Sphingomonas sp.]